MKPDAAPKPPRAVLLSTARRSWLFRSASKSRRFAGTMTGFVCAAPPMEQEFVMNSIFPQTRCTARRRWMIVDDDENILSLMHKFAARTSDADIECFLSPHEALAAFKATPESFELVITDLEMPGMDRIELGRQLDRK